MITYLFIITLNLIVLNKLIPGHNVILLPGKIISYVESQNWDEDLYEIYAQNLKPNHYYKIMLHYIGAVSIYHY